MFVVKGRNKINIIRLIPNKRTFFPFTTSTLPSLAQDFLFCLSFSVLFRLDSDFHKRAFPGGSDGKESACNMRDLGQEDPLEKEMATHSSILAGKVSWTEEPGGLQSTGSQSQTQLSN